MVSKEFRDWLNAKSPITRRFILFGMIGWFASCFIFGLQTLIWRGAGWGSANFLPVWVLFFCYIVAAAVGVASFYYSLAHSARFQKRIRWVTSALFGVVGALLAMIVLAESLPQLSTLVLSSHKSVELEVYRSTFDTRGKHCRLDTRFGPFFAFRGRWCGVNISQGNTYVFEGQGNALALRIKSYQK